MDQSTTTIIRKFQVIGLNHYRDFEIDFNQPYRILVGENGLGKTSIMNVFYYVLTRNWLMLDKVQFDFIELSVRDFVIDFSQSELRMYVTSAMNEEGYIDQDAITKFNVIDNTLKSYVTNKVVYFPIFRHLDQFLVPLFSKRIYDFIKHRNTIEKGVKDFVVDNLVFDMIDLRNKLDSFKGTATLTKFKNLCNKYLVETRFDVASTNNAVVINKNNNEQVAIENLSSGEKQIINFFARTYLADQNDLIILIDEPEISLSINWQQSLLPDMLDSNNCALLFVITHSPFTFQNRLDRCAVAMNLFTKKYAG